MGTPVSETNYLTAREAADYLRISLSTLYRMERTGLLEPLRTPGGHRRYTQAMLDACLAAPDHTFSERSTNGTSA